MALAIGTDHVQRVCVWACRVRKLLVGDSRRSDGQKVNGFFQISLSQDTTPDP